MSTKVIKFKKLWIVNLCDLLGVGYQSSPSPPSYFWHVENNNYKKCLGLHTKCVSVGEIIHFSDHEDILL